MVTFMLGYNSIIIKDIL